VLLSGGFFNFTIFFSSKLFAKKQGQAKIESLLKELAKAKGETNEVILLDVLSSEYFFISPDKGIKYGEDAINFAQKLKWENGISGTLNSLGSCFVVKSNYPKALDYYLKALKINEELGYKSDIAQILCNIGELNFFLAKYSSALQYCFRALKISEELGKNGPKFRAKEQQGRLTLK
jgi:tetratricopeptide (TPR) repeat protein